VGSTVGPDTTRTRALVGRWNGDFEFVPSAPVDPALDVRLTGVDWAGGDIWAVGYVSDSVNGKRARIERYHRQPGGSTGEAVASPLVDGDSALHGVAMLSDTNGWAVGGSGPGKGGFTQTFIAHWDGTAWSKIPSPSPGTKNNQLNAVAARAADDVWAVGQCANSARGGQAEPLVLRWDGAAWSQVPVAVSAVSAAQLLGVAVAGQDTVWAVGTRFPITAGGQPLRPSALALRWDGAEWHNADPGGPVTQFSGVSARSETEVWFAGYAEPDAGGPKSAHVEHWDGKELSPDDPATNSGPASALSAITVDTDHLMAVGWWTPVRPNQVAGALLGSS
jgi:hypothetical protein